MSERQFMLVACTHVDLAWKRGPEEMSEMLEVMLIRILDSLEQHPAFRYTLEQCAHYRTLERRRPDLVQRMGPYLKQGRLEIAGCMASTLDTNLPAGESFVRNQLLGLKWAKQTWDYAPRSGWLLDTFGINAQVPQILRQFGITRLSANRLGGDKFQDVMLAEGLDGTKLLVVGQDVYSAYVRPEHVVPGYYENWTHLDNAFASADRLTGPGPFVLLMHTENEYLVSLRAFDELRSRGTCRAGERWGAGTISEYLDAVDETRLDWPVVSADLNPEFTGCFSLRPKIRLCNRRAETLLLDAEKWAALAGLRNSSEGLEEAWWRMAFVQFHDVFTGSHPTNVYRAVLETLDGVEAVARQVFAKSIGEIAPESGREWVAVNGLPWTRREVVRLPGRNDAGEIEQIFQNGELVPFDIRGDEARALLSVPAGGMTPVIVRRSLRGGSTPADDDVQNASMENAFIRIEFDRVVGLRRLIWKPTSTVLIEGAGDLLIVQQDDGNFQIESPAGSEVVAAAGTLRLRCARTANASQQIVLSGDFPPLAWAGKDASLKWEIEFSLTPHKPAIDMSVRLNWRGEASRVRLKVSTRIDSSEGTYEVPFGTVQRRPYGVRGTARGEWPAQRFVAIENSTHGVALANNGAAGVEVGGGRITTSLLRAPSAKYAGMVPDDTSSAHGEHEYAFALIPYAGHWVDAGVSRFAQELNNPIRMAAGTIPSATSFVSLDSDRIVLSSIKRPEDGSDDVIVRVFETTGQTASASLRIAGMTRASLSDLPESRGESIPVAGESVRLQLKPFEIQTLRVHLTRR